MPISDSDAAQVLATCARHCCICRRFRPGHLQIHHIIEQADGVDDSLGNLIPICISCHADVHAATKLTRRFTPAELRAHRDTVYDLVAKGLLPSREAIAGDAIQHVSDAIVHRLQELGVVSDGRSSGLSPESTSILLAALCEESPIQVAAAPDGFSLETGQQRFYFRRLDGEPLPAPLQELVSKGAIHRTETDFAVTQRGIDLGSELVTTAAKFTEVKVKCMSCSLHFIILTWYPERHSVQTVICPECGQRNGGFIIWRQRAFGFIFQHVPGNAS